ncbi:hypothetical protein AF332_11295 [Sporosarcina globispora]|uniref:Uncharacterized protein n=1 Tax=Sporosarcina globispora TaxID=1459 RepID=A0A0M0GCT5_SPOGL|nr:hypothetical protein [Sporosarcina globispora]KON87352.1 hypothetical protein AF332_11295 [Sporosarcina globispora]
MENYPNVMIVPENDETPEEMIEDYVEMIHYNLERNIPLEEILWDFFTEINRWSCKQFLIDSAKQSLQELENLHEMEMSEASDFEDEE